MNGLRQEDLITNDKLNELISAYRLVFDVVRMVDVSKRKEISFHKDGSIEVKDGFCHSVWKKDKRCINCISARAYTEKDLMTKFEFVDNEIFYVMAKYMQFEEVECVLELVQHVKDTTLIGAYGQTQFIQKITNFNEKIYMDSLTKVRNRRYFDEQLLGLPIKALAVIDIDYFKSINDTYGHTMGDIALSATARCIERTIKDDDLLIRYGGDEFIIAFEDIRRDVLERVLTKINKNIKAMVNPLNKDLTITLSIGAVYGDAKCGEMFKQADDALYEAKLNRDCHSIHDYIRKD